MRARRGPHTLAANFATGPTRVACEGSEIELCAGGEAHLESGYITLPGMSAALIR